ncbi:MAG: exosortase-associated EpsI family protein [Planctomycetota bacterium]|nr:exosortase-associated EpsI family protein [Planctomycetota bacterium]
MYPVRHKHRTERIELSRSARRVTGKTLVWSVWLLAVLLLTSAGIMYRAMATRLDRIVNSVTLPVSLDAYPRRIEQWVGEDVPIPLNIQQAAGNDAFVNRLYRNQASKEWVNVYIAYSARPRTMLGHRPRICYVAGGWTHDGTQTAQFTSRTGKELPCLVHRFHRPAPEHEETVVLNFYIVNGQLTCDDRVFTGVGWRTPNIGGDPARYVAQVQISSMLENSTLAAARDMAELIFDFFPDENGQVKAVEYVEPPMGLDK